MFLRHERVWLQLQARSALTDQLPVGRKPPPPEAARSLLDLRDGWTRFPFVGRCLLTPTRAVPILSCQAS